MQHIWANILSGDVHSQLQFCAAMKRLSGFSVGMLMPYWMVFENANEHYNSRKKKKNKCIGFF